MRKALWLLMSFFVVSVWVGWVEAGDNRDAPRLDVADRFSPMDNRWKVRVTTTTTAANTAVCLVSSHTVINFVVPSSATFSPSVASSTTTTYGGRNYFTFQVVRGASNVSVDFDTVDLSTTTSPFLTEGQWFSPDDPVAWQGMVCLMSPSTFTATGWYFTDKHR